MKNNKLKRELKRLQNRLKKESIASKVYEVRKEENYSLYLDERRAKEKLEEELDLIKRIKKKEIFNDLSDVFHDNYSRMNVFVEVQNICITSIGTDSEQTNRAEHYAWFFAYIHSLLKREANSEFNVIEKQFSNKTRV